MKLIEESYHILDSNECEIPVYIKKYDEDGKLISLLECEFDESTFTSFHYDKNGRIQEELIYIDRSYGTPVEELKKQYVYNNIGYSIITIQLREIHDTITSEKFKNGALIFPEDYSSKHPKETNRLVFVEEFSLSKEGLVFSVRTNNLISNSIEIKEYEYQENFESIVYYSLIGNEKKLEKEMLREFDNNKSLISEREIVYLNGIESIVNFTEYKYWQTDESNPTKHKTIITSDGTEIIEKYDHYDNLLQITNNLGDRTIYLNEYNEAYLLESSIGVYVRDDYHKLSSKRLLKYR